MERKNIIIITGASSGMGKEFVKQVDARFPKVDELWLIARRKDALVELAASCNHKCRVLPYDLSQKSSWAEMEQLLKTEQPDISLLVNSAGYGILGPFFKEESKSTVDLSEMTVGYNNEALEDQVGMIAINCEALTAITYLCIPYMKKGGRIIQLASSAAFLPQPKFAVYAATKSYVLSFSRALNEELRQKRIFVTAVCPGPVDTEFFERAEKGSDTLFIKKLVMARPEQVVEKALRDSCQKKEISVYGTLMNLFYFASKILPHKWMLRVMRIMK